MTVLYVVVQIISQETNADLFQFQIPSQLRDGSPVVLARQHLPHVPPVTEHKTPG